MKIKRLVSSVMLSALLLTLLCSTAYAASFYLHTEPGATGSERVYSQSVVSRGTGINQIATHVSSFYRNGSGNAYGTCTSHTTVTPVVYTSTGSKTIVVSSGVAAGTLVTVLMQLQNVGSNETIRVSGTVG